MILQYFQCVQNFELSEDPTELLLFMCNVNMVKDLLYYFVFKMPPKDSCLLCLILDLIFVSHSPSC